MLLATAASAQPLVFQMTPTGEWLLSPLGDKRIFRLRLRPELKTGLFCHLKFNWSSLLNRYATILAAVEVTSPGKLNLVNRPVPEPGPRQVRVRVEAAGICHSDGRRIWNPLRQLHRKTK